MHCPDTETPFLVLTGLDAPPDREPRVHLGDWCELNVNSQDTSAPGETLPFHWDDRRKLARDYEYLEGLHHRLVPILASSLNALHDVDRSARYWQIILEPWLLSYVAVMFDRWQTVERAFEIRRSFRVRALYAKEGGEAPPLGYSEFLCRALDHRWNQGALETVVRHRFGAHAQIQEPKQPTPIAPLGEDPPARPARTTEFIDRLLGWLPLPHDIVFLGAGFDLRPLIKLNMALGQAPRLYLREFREGHTIGEDEADHALRSKLFVEPKAENEFEEFLFRRLRTDIPSSAVEHFARLRSRASAIRNLRPKVVVSASAHWHDSFARVWVAEQVARGATFVSVEHGGSLPPFRELFDFEVDVADVRATWFAPYHSKHRQLPPARLVGRFDDFEWDESGHLSVIANECPPWVYRAQFYPMVKQWEPSFEMVKTLVGLLSEGPQAAARVKPYPSDQGWDTKARFQQEFGTGRVTTGVSLDRVMSDSRMVVCTYPETTFAEAMASGVPCLLMYPTEFYELHPACIRLLDVLRDARIAFHDARAAAMHINQIWPDPLTWWRTGPVVEARDDFARTALGADQPWLGTWTAFLRALVAEATS